MRMSVLGVGVAAVVAGMSAGAFASPIPYGNVGSPAPYTPLYAAATGNLIGISVVNGGAGEDQVRLYDETTKTYSAYGLDNKTTPVGGTFNFGPVNAGDLLSFQILNSDDQRRLPGLVSSTDPSISQDGVTHAFVSKDGSYVYLAMEDLSNYGPGGYTDYNYGDLTFAFSVNQVTTTKPVVATPEPASLALVGTGVVGLAGALRRRRQR